MTKLLVIFEAYVGLIAHDAFISRHDLAALHQRIRSFQPGATKPSAEATNLVTHALDVACAFYPKQALCLQRSSVLVGMLRKRGVAAKMVIGAQKLPFKAHAWVEVDGEIVNDRLASRDKFLVLEVC
jgi:hypothetical protein